MTQLALYRRWRPQTFAELLGQEHVARTLQAQVRDGRVAHAYLFSGPRGTGKTSAARILAKALNCEKGPTPEPCNGCDSCRAITDGASFDVIEIDAASHGRVEDVRELRENVLLAPAAARRKVYIVDEAHMVSREGWNAFLKTLEEPPDHVVFVFATTEPHKVLPTIVSRCQRFDFRRVSTQAIAEHLAKVCAEEGIAADDGALQLVARNAEGGVRDALSALDQLASMPHVTVEAAAQLLGSATSDVLFEFAEALGRRDTAAAVSVLARVVEEGRDLRLFTRQILDHLRALFLIRQIGGPQELIDATEETRAQLTNQADLFEPARLVHLLRLFVEAQADMRQQAAPRLALELAVVRATVPEADDTAVAALARIERLERLLDVGVGAPDAAPPDAGSRAGPASSSKGGAAREASVGTAPPPRSGKKVAPTKPAAKAPAPPSKKSSEGHDAPSSVAEAVPSVLVDIEKLRRSWPVLLEEVRKVSPRLHAFVAEAVPAGFDGRELVIETRFSYHAERLMAEKDAAILAKAVEAVFGVAPRIKAVVGESAAPQQATSPPAPADDPLDLVKRSLGAEEIED